jgi:hypothetical protein
MVKILVLEIDRAVHDHGLAVLVRARARARVLRVSVRGGGWG